MTASKAAPDNATTERVRPPITKEQAGDRFLASLYWGLDENLYAQRAGHR